VGIVVALLSTLCALSGADDPPMANGDLEQARQRVEKMSDGERVRIRKNFHTFRALPAERQEQLLALHAELQADPKLGDVMKRYYDWFVTLDAGQQDDLRNARSTAQKVSRVKEFRKAQADERSSQDWAELPARARLLSSFNEKQLAEVMMILESSLPLENFKSEEKSRLAALSNSPHQRQSLVFAYVIEHEIEKDRIRGTPQPMPPDLMRKLSEVADPKLLVSRGPGIAEMPWLPKLMLFTVLAKSLDEQLKSPPPTQSELEKLFAEELSGSERDEIMRLRVEEGQRKLADQYREAHPELYPLDTVRRYRDSVRRYQKGPEPGSRAFSGGQGADQRPDDRKGVNGAAPFRPRLRPNPDK
jgi:hypothetical protein